MSHISKIELQVTDLDALKAAIKRLHPDLEFREGQTTYRWYGEFVGDSPIPDGMKSEDYGKCLHAIGYRKGANPDPLFNENIPAYELGVVKMPGQKGYTLVYDNHIGGYGLEHAIGKGAGLLKQAYAREVATRQMRRQGYRILEQTQEDGSVRLLCTKPGKG